MLGTLLWNTITLLSVITKPMVEAEVQWNKTEQWNEVE